MIKINNPRIEEIAEEYFNKIDMTIETFPFLNQNKREILLSKPNQLLSLIDKFSMNYNQNFVDFKKIMYKLYSNNINKHGHWLTKTLDVKVCPYCNLNFTHTITKKRKKIRPEFDHFYPKSVYPLLSLSFYNLIPSCPVCNHTKKTILLEINPYSDDFSENPFEIEQPLDAIFYGKNRQNNEDSKKWLIRLKDNRIDSKYSKNIQTFGLEDRYNEIKDYAEEIVFKALTYNDGYYESILQTFDQMLLTKSEMDRIIFGNYVSPEDFHKRPLSKLTHDILEQFDVKF